MAITNPTSKLVGSSTLNQTAYTTAAVVLDANKWYTIQIHGYRSPSASTISSVIHNVAGTPLSFVNITFKTWQTNRRGEVWSVRPASTTASAVITITWGAGQSACGWTLTEWPAGIDQTVFFVNTNVVSNSGAAGTASSVTMGTYSATDNATWFITFLGTGTADPAEDVVINESRVEVAEVDDAERAQHADHYQNPHGGDTSLTSSWTNAEDWGAIGIEVKAAVTATASPVFEYRVPAYA